MSLYPHQDRYAQTEKGKAARRKAQDNWNAKRRQARAASKSSSEVRCPAARSVFELGHPVHFAAPLAGKQQDGVHFHLAAPRSSRALRAFTVDALL